MNLTNINTSDSLTIENYRKISLYFTASLIIVGLIGNSVTIFVFAQVSIPFEYHILFFFFALIICN